MADAIAIQLGGRGFTARPLTFRQLREIERALHEGIAAGAHAKINLDIAVDILTAALSRAEPALTREEILDLEGTMTEIATATRAILVASGFIERKEPNLGEASAGN